MGIREGLWDCPACQGKNRGRQVRCQGCGLARGPDVKFYLPEGEPEILPDNPLYQEAKAGPDWICGYCDTSNRSTAPKCTGCGAGAEDGKHRKVVDLPLGGAAAAAPPPPKSPGAAAAVGAAPGPSPSSGGGGKGCGCGCLSMLLLFLLLGWWGSLTSDTALQIAAVRWQRTIKLEDYKTYQESAWSDGVPSGARQTRQSREVRSHRSVLDHYQTVTRTRQVKVGSHQVKCGTRDLGNGYFEDKYCDQPDYESQQYTEQEPVYRQEPIYDTKVYFDIDRWKATTPAVAQGTDMQPAWPAVTLGDRLREAGREAKYTVTAKGPDGTSYDLDVAEALFIKCPPGTAVVGAVNNFGKLVELKQPER